MHQELTVRPPDLRLIVITDRSLAAPRSVRDVVEAALAAGAPAVQLRDKDATARDLLEQARVLRELTRRTRALLFVNDRMDVALAAGADGVHLGPRDIPVADARNAARLAGRPDFLIGTSTDDPETARRAVLAGASYIGCGAVFGTTSKPEVGDERIGPDRLRDVVRAAAAPVVAIGGITPVNAPQVAATGAAGLAVISAVMAAPDIQTAVKQLLSALPPSRAV